MYAYILGFQDKYACILGFQDTYACILGFQDMYACILGFQDKYACNLGFQPDICLALYRTKLDFICYLHLVIKVLFSPVEKQNVVYRIAKSISSLMILFYQITGLVL